MLVLLLGDYDSLSCNLIDIIIKKNSDIKIDFITKNIDNNTFHEKVNYIIGCRRDISILRSIKTKYDVVIDLNSVLKNDIENIFNEIQFDKYILKSTFQTYHFMPKNTILTEDSITESYYKDVLDLYLSSKYNSHEIYAREKLKCERTLIKKSEERKTKYIIFRPSKIYCNQDKFNDLNWIIKRLNNKCPIILKSSDVLHNNMFNPIYVKDLAHIINTFLINENINNEIFNIAQDQLINTSDIIKCLGEIKSKQFEICIINDEHFNQVEFKNYRAPNLDTKILSNDRLKKYIDFKFTDYKLWIEEISNNLIDNNNLKIDNYIEEKKYIKRYLLMQQKVMNIKIIQ